MFTYNNSFDNNTIAYQAPTLSLIFFINIF